MSDGWLRFVMDHNIPHRSATKKWSLEIKCPFCLNDPSFRMALKSDGAAFGCIVDKAHGGHRPEKLIKAVLGVSEARALEIASMYFSWADVNVRPQEVLKDLKPITPPEEFLPFISQTSAIMRRYQKMFTKYLKTRGLDPVYTCTRFDLRWCMEGQFSGRLIVPVKSQGKWYTYLGRSIDPDNWLRYLTPKLDAVPENFLFDQDNLKGGEALVVNEGWGDAAKIANSFIAGVDATAVLGKRLSEDQHTLLCSVADRYKSILIMLDRDALHDGLRMFKSLSYYFSNIKVIPPGAKDPGSMSTDDIKRTISTALD